MIRPPNDKRAQIVQSIQPWRRGYRRAVMTLLVDGEIVEELTFRRSAKTGQTAMWLRIPNEPAPQHLRDAMQAQFGNLFERMQEGS